MLNAKEWNLRSTDITCIKPERTFWDKIYIVDRICRDHEEQKLKRRTNPKSRHHYDVAIVGSTELGKAALANMELAEKVRIAFQAPDDAKPGALRLVPPEDVMRGLRQDYERGASRMIFGKAPDFNWVVDELRKLQEAINGNVA